MTRRKTNAATAPVTPPLTVVSPPDALEPPYAGEPIDDGDTLLDVTDEPFADEGRLVPAAEAVRQQTLAAATAPKPAPSPRKVSAETVKAETRLINMERQAKVSLMTLESKWAEKRLAFIRALPHDVQGMLLAGQVITDDDLEPAP